MTHLCIPFLSEVAGLESIIFWFICGGLGVFTPLIIAGVMTLRKEGGKFTKETFVERLRFRPMSRRRLALFTSGVGGNRTLDKWNYDCDASPFFGFQPYSVVYDFGSAFTGKILAIACMVPILVAQYRRRRVLLERCVVTSARKDFRRQNVDITWHWLGYFSYSVWLATTCYVITAIVYRALCGTKDTEHMDRSISTWGNQWS